MYTVILKKNEEKRIKAGHPWVYANEVLRIEGKGKNGELAEVCDCEGRYIGSGYINHLSKILVRIMIRDHSEDSEEFFIDRILKAKEAREKLGYSDSYRAVFSEADDLPGLIVDKYHDILSVQILTFGMDKNREKIVSALVKVFSPRGIYERSDNASREKEGLLQKKGAIYGEFDPDVVIEENGIKMNVDVENGQKTGYFLDQKDNRFAIRKYSKGARVLDCFSNVGGFSMNAAFAGAESVKAVDISERALDEVKLNSKLNGFEDRIETICGDVFEILRSFRSENEKFDLVILDPPAFCKSASDLPAATKGYKEINISGMKIVKSGGYLVSSSCSHFMTFPLFEKMLRDAARESGRKVRMIEMKMQSSDHPALLSEDESLYLKFFVMQVF